MKILIDGDACPVKEITIDVAKVKQIPVEIFFDTAHVYQNDYAKVTFVNKGSDSVDFEVLKKTAKGDIVITNDYGLSAMILSKGGSVLSPSGLIISNSNINQLLGQRYLSAKARKAKVRTRGPKKRTQEDNKRYLESLQKLIDQLSK